MPRSKKLPRESEPESRTVVFRDAHGWRFEVRGSGIDDIDSVSWLGADLDVPDFVSQLADGEKQSLDAILRGDAIPLP